MKSGVPQRAAVDRARQQFEECAEVGLVEFLGRGELPQHRAEPVAEFEHAGIVEPLDAVAGLGQHLAVRRIARPLQGEHEVGRDFGRPFAKTLRLLRAVERAVDLDRGQLRGGVFEFLPLRQFVGIEHAAPRLIGPAADADADVAVAFHSGLPLAHPEGRAYLGFNGDGAADESRAPPRRTTTE